MWAGINWNSRTSIVIFEGKLNALGYIDILSQTKYPNSHRLMADNDPKHTLNCAKEFIEDTGINWWRTPAYKYIRHLRKVLPSIIQREGGATGY